MFDPTVFLAALVAGPILSLFTFFGMKMHYDEMRTGEEPSWSGWLIFGGSGSMIALVLIAQKYWFFWNLLGILVGVGMTAIGTYQVCRLLSLLLSGQMRSQHPETED